WRLGRTCAELGSKTSEGTAATARPSPGISCPGQGWGLKLMTLANKLGTIALKPDPADGTADITLTFTMGGAGPKNKGKIITLTRTAADGLWKCTSDQDEQFIPKGCSK
ncbi:pilin, partial [Pseudomonas aeruginosa]|uniref:pilin n=2 Tax=Pseudomonas aeruginosa TaxID=287 RepID=UPI00158BD0A2